MPTSVLMCPPTFFDVREAKNPHMGKPIDRVLAQHQWNNLRRAFQDCGVKVEFIDPAKGLDDMVFAANQGFVGVHPETGPFIVPSRMRYHSRNEEVPFYLEWFSARGYKIIDLELTGENYLEGHGDLLWHHDRSRIWAGYGFRSSFGGVERFSAAMDNMGFRVTPLELVDPYCYHLDTCLCPLNGDAALVYPAAFSGDSLVQLRAGFARIHELDREEVLQFIANGVALNGRFITPRLSPNLLRILAQEGLTPLVVDTSEFEKSGGSVFCMKLFMD